MCPLYYMPFLKSGTKPLPYPTMPWGIDKKYKNQQNEPSENENEQLKENERLKAIIFFENWARATKKQFKEESG